MLLDLNQIRNHSGHLWCKSWLGIEDGFQTFDELIDCEVEDIYRLLDTDLFDEKEDYDAAVLQHHHK